MSSLTICCDHCSAKIVSTRFKCNPITGCNDFDLCEECYLSNTNQHDVNHHFIKITAPVKPAPALKADSSLDIFLKACDNYASFPCFGSKLNSETPSSSRDVLGVYAGYEFTTYADFKQQCLSFGTNLQRLCNLPLRSLIGIFVPNCAAWLIADYACLLYSYVSVGIHVSYSEGDVRKILLRSGIQAVVIKDANQMRLLARIANSTLR